MYLDCADEAAAQIDTVVQMIASGVDLRAILANAPNIGNAAITALANRYPSTVRVAVFEHSAVVTRLYAIYERCVNDLVAEWLSELPSLVPDYSTLGPSFAEAHRRGISQVLKHMHVARFATLSAARISTDYANAISGVPDFSILPQCFLSENRTFGLDHLCQVLASVLINDTAVWILEHPLICTFVEITRGGQTTCEAELRTFIEYRNDAAHGRISDTWGPVPLRECAEFVAALCRALAEKFELSRLQLLKRHRALAPLGTVTEVFKKPRAIIAVMAKSQISVGQRLMVSTTTSCHDATIIDLQDNGQTLQTIQARCGQEVGIKLDCLPPNGAELFDA